MYVGPKPGESAGWLRNLTASSKGWQWVDGKGGWHDDPSLTILSGPLTPLSRKYIVKATGAAAETHPSSLGVFTKTEKWWRGRPVFINTQGQLLYHAACWGIGDTFGYAALRGSQSHHSPDTERSWTYWTGSEYKSAFVTVTSSD